MKFNSFCRPLALARKTTSVVNVRDAANFTYIGRKCADFEQSPFHNPFTFLRAFPEQRRKCIERFRQHFFTNPELQQLALDQLKGKTLGCWCHPLDCHGDVIADFVNRHTGYSAVFFIPQVEGRDCCDNEEEPYFRR